MYIKIRSITLIYEHIYLGLSMHVQNYSLVLNFLNFNTARLYLKLTLVEKYQHVKEKVALALSLFNYFIHPGIYMSLTLYLI